MRQARGAAYADGTTYDDTEIATVSAELDALSEAEGEVVRRDRKAQADARTVQRTKSVNQLLKAHTARLEAVGKAEKAASELVAALVDIEAQASVMQECAVSLGSNRIGSISTNSLRGRLARMLTRSFKPLMGTSSRWGSIGFPPLVGKEVRMDGDWKAYEASLSETELELITKGATENG